MLVTYSAGEIPRFLGIVRRTYYRGKRSLNTFFISNYTLVVGN